MHHRHDAPVHRRDSAHRGLGATGRGAPAPTPGHLDDMRQLQPHPPAIRRGPGESRHSAGSSRPHPGQLLGDPPRDVGHRQHVAGPAGLQRRAGHAVDRGALPVLRDADAAGIMDPAQPLGAIAPDVR